MGSQATRIFSNHPISSPAGRIMTCRGCGRCHQCYQTMLRRYLEMTKVENVFYQVSNQLPEYTMMAVISEGFKQIFIQLQMYTTRNYRTRMNQLLSPSIIYQLISVSDKNQNKTKLFLNP